VLVLVLVLLFCMCPADFCDSGPESLWFLVLQEFGALQMSLLKHNRRLKQRDSLPLNAPSGAGGSEVPSVLCYVMLL